VKVCFAGALLLLAAPLAAQSVRGRAIDQETRAVIAGALVELRDSADRPVARMLTSPTGAYLFALGRTGRFAVRVAAIGYLPSVPTPIIVSGSGITVPDVALLKAVFTLPDLVTAAKGRACGLLELRHGTFADVLESAHTALNIVDAAFDARTLRFAVQLVRASTIFGPDGGSKADTSIASITSWPIQSTDLDSLRAVGFAREPAEDEPRGLIYYGPDARVLFSDWFLEAHCFTLVIDRSTAGADSVRMHFEPRHAPKLVDISGDMVFDRASMSLRRLEFSHVNLPRGIPEGAAGGLVEFDRWSSGLWLPTGWALWGPIERETMVRASLAGQLMVPRRAVAGRAESRGKVIEVVRR
jgi:hypothetical protein